MTRRDHLVYHISIYDLLINEYILQLFKFSFIRAKKFHDLVVAFVDDSFDFHINQTHGRGGYIPFIYVNFTNDSTESTIEYHLTSYGIYL